MITASPATSTDALARADALIRSASRTGSRPASAPGIPTKRAAIYARQSKTDDQGVERQIERGIALIAARGWTHVGTYIDNDVTASKPRGAQTAWGRMLAAAADIDVTVSVDLDRVVRSTRDLNTLIDHGLALITLDGEIDLTTADGEFRASMLAAIARFEVRRKGERQTRANAQRAAGGGVPKGARLFGFETDGTIREDEAEVVRALFEGFGRGDTLRTLARRFDSTPSSVRDRLLNPRYAGRRVYKGEVVGTLPAAIIDPALFDLVHVRLTDPRRLTNTSGSTARKYLGSGLYLCECGDPRPVVSGGDGQRYRCRACGLIRRRESVDAYVLTVLSERLKRPDALDAMRPAAPDVSALLTEQVAVKGRLDSLAALVADGTLDADAVRAAAEPLRTRLEEVGALLAAGTTSPVLHDLRAIRRRLRTEWRTMPLDRRRAIVDAFVTVTLHRAPRGSKVFDPSTVSITWKVG
ncbi:recombinase family protein [Cellulomonas sp. CW35]|uniref:recombinase family protein n=1 Tax=Cellulomonas sp. CW35 TaxID=3458249 RepID=UPI004033E96D